MTDIEQQLFELFEQFAEKYSTRIEIFYFNKYNKMASVQKM